jgi:hypothetical protein
MKFKIKINNVLFFVAAVLSVLFYIAYMNQKIETKSARFNAGVLAQRVGILKAYLNFEHKNYVYYICSEEPTQEDMKVRDFYIAKDMGFKIEKLNFETEIYPLFLNKKHIKTYGNIEKNICRQHNHKLIALVKEQGNGL